MRHFLFFLILSTTLSAQKASAQEFSEEERLKGFAQHNQRNQEFDRIRLSGANEIKKKREAWQEHISKSVEEYKASKQKQAKTVDESSPEYKVDFEQKKKVDQAYEETRKQYIKQRDAQRARRKVTIKLSEEEEYGLNEVGLRADIKKRALYGGQTGFKSIRGRGAGISSGNTDFASPPPPPNPPEFNPPPPQPPEFFEPEIPPPPPPEFDEPIPPPVFDDPDF